MVPLAAVPETIVDARDAAVPSAVKPAISGMEAAVMEAAASVKTAARAMRARVGEVRLAERNSEKQGTRDSSQDPS
jgi:hypothetical protein